MNDAWIHRHSTEQGKRANSRSSGQASISFVCCIEKGRLESQTVLMLKTLRKYGGNLANAPVFVVKGRVGSSIAPATLRLLRDLNATYVEAIAHNDAPWFNYSNKLAAVSFAQNNATTDLIAWLDSDVLVASEPTGLLLDSNTDFAARAEYLPPAVHEGTATYIPYWKAVCNLLGADFNDIPWIHLDVPAVRLRVFFNSGIFVWRRNTSFAKSYKSAFKTLLKSKLAPVSGNPWWADQVVISPILARDNIKWQHLDRVDHHMAFPGHLVGRSATPSMSRSHLIHYSRSFEGDSEPLILSRLQAEVPHVYEEVMQHRDSFAFQEAGLPWLPLKAYRKLRLLHFLKTLQVAEAGVPSTAPEVDPALLV